MDPGMAAFGILGALLLGAMSPGPSFLVVAQTSIAFSRRDGLAAALGMGVGGLIFGGLALIGLQAILLQIGSLHLVLTVVGGAYLLYLAIGLWRGATHPIDVPTERGQRGGRMRRSFGHALGTQLSNPKTGLVYASIFAAFLPATLPLSSALAMLSLILVVETGWYSIVAIVLSTGRPRATYLRWKTWVDRAAGSVMGALGLRLIADGRLGLD